MRRALCAAAPEPRAARGFAREHGEEPPFDRSEHDGILDAGRREAVAASVGFLPPNRIYARWIFRPAEPSLGSGGATYPADLHQSRSTGIYEARCCNPTLSLPALAAVPLATTLVGEMTFHAWPAVPAGQGDSSSADLLGRHRMTNRPKGDAVWPRSGLLS
jgi:hypothetical protein